MMVKKICWGFKIFRSQEALMTCTSCSDSPNFPRVFINYYRTVRPVLFKKKLLRKYLLHGEEKH